MKAGNALWFNNFGINAGAALRLFAFPFAGGSAAAYRTWAGKLPGVEVVAVCLPGRERRIEEAAFDSLPALMGQLVPQIAPLLDRPFALFGHSMGALLAFELARRLDKAHLPQPEQLFVSAFHVPEMLPQRQRLAHLPDQEFLERLTRYGGIPAAVLETPELLRLLVPTMRADFGLLETFDYRAGPLLACDIAAFYGTSDHAAPCADMKGWGRHTSGGFTLSGFEGGHFFLKSAEDALLASIAATLESRQAASAARMWA